MRADLGLDRMEAVLIEADPVHLVDHDRHLPHPEQVQEVAVPAGLVAHAFGRIDHQQRGVGLRRAGDHVAQKLGMARRIDQDDVARWGAQADLAGIDGDALITLGLQRVEQERPFERHAAARAHRLERVELAVGQAAGLMQQAADQGRLAVVDVADDDDPHQWQRGRGDRAKIGGDESIHGAHMLGGYK